MPAFGATKYYYDYHYPLPVVQFLLDLIFGKDKPGVDPANREWFSQPRPGTDPTTEVVTCLFKLPLSVSEITMDILRVPCSVEVWYLDRANNWREVLDMQRIPVKVAVSRSDGKSFYKYHTRVYPIVAKQLQFRLTRLNDRSLEGSAYVCGLRNCLIRRNVYERSQGTAYFEEEQDVLGNVITKYIKDWDASRACDDNATTFWKSEPMPDPHAVACLYLDVRDPEGMPRNIDRVFIDPVYMGQHLNLYYSNDEIVGTRKLSPITCRPTDEANTVWRNLRGRLDTATAPSAETYYRFPLVLGPLRDQAAWIGVEWTPFFDPTDGPPQNPVLLEVMDPTGPAFAPKLHYDVGSAEFVLSFFDGFDVREYRAPCTQLFGINEPVRIVAGWRYDPDTVHLHVHNRRGETIAAIDSNPSTLPHLVSFDGTVQFANWRGNFMAHVIKLENWAVSSDQFLANATFYTNPDPLIPDIQGQIPASTLDNAVYAASWIAQEHGSGGAHQTAYEDKEWMPIWRDYQAVRGMLYLPQPISMKFLKLEFSQLTEEPYPIYESDIEVRYKVFPINVLQQTSIGPKVEIGSGGFLGQGSFVAVNNVNSVNWLNPDSVMSAIGQVWGPRTPPVVITNGTPYVTDTLPNQQAQPSVEQSLRVEAGSSYVYRRDKMQPYILSQNAYVTAVKTESIQVLGAYHHDVPWQDIAAANPGAITEVRSTGLLPVRGTDWWLYPGQQLRVPAAVMTKLTGTSTIIERHLTLERRIRFSTACIHRYEYKTVKRDAAIAYFAGLREVQPYTSTYIAGEDRGTYDFPSYDGEVWVRNNVRQIPEGPVTTAADLYRPENPSFDPYPVGSLVTVPNPIRGLTGWTPDLGDVAWSWDGTTGHWKPGAAVCSPDGNDNGLTSSRLTVTPGDQVTFKIWVKWTGLVASGSPITLGGISFSEGVVDDTLVFDDVSAPGASSDWVQLSGTWTVPAGVDSVRVRLGVTEDASAGKVWFDNLTVQDGAADATGTLARVLETASTFAKVRVDFRDSGLIRSDSMWADAAPDTANVGDEALAYYVTPIPATIPSGMWSDTIKAWAGDDVQWGTPFAVISITIDGTRRYQGKRVLTFRRAAGAGEAGIKVKQWTHMIPQGLARIGVVAYKALSNDNQAILRLRRLTDGVIVYEETVNMVSGRWWEYQTKFFELPNTPDQDYEVMFTADGDDEDLIYLSDLYTEVAQIRYFIRLGGVGDYLHEVTDLRHAKDPRVTVTTTTPVNQMSVQAVILSPEAWAFGCTITPYYLR